MQELHIRELDVNLIRPSPESLKWDLEHPDDRKGGSKITVIGKPGTGKSVLITSLLYEKRHLFPAGLVFSGTEDSNSHWGTIFPELFVYDKLDIDVLDAYIRRQKTAKQYLPYLMAWSVLLMDDCTDDTKVFNLPIFQGLYKNGRHWCMFYILSLQYCMDVRPVIRTNVDGVFILREPNLRNRRAIHENYAGIIEDFSLFCQIMDEITDDYTALYIHNQGTSNRLEDNVFWYKARRVPSDFKFGCQDLWEFNRERYNNDYQRAFFK